MLWEEFSEFPTETIRVEPWKSEDAAGKQVYGSAKAIPAVVQGPSHRYIDRFGLQVVPRSMAFVGPDVDISPKDRVTFADGTVPQLIQLDKMNWGPAVDFQILWFR